LTDMRVLVVEDETALAEAVARGLRREGMAVDVATDGAAAIDRITVNGYDVVVLDRDLPVMHGDDVCRAVSTLGGPRVLMLTAASDISERVRGLSLGADDYLPKPFAFEELVARIRALARRPSTAMPPVLERSGLRLDARRRAASRNGEYLPLTRKELGVLEVLMAADGAVVSSEELLEKVWDEHADPFTNAVRVTVMNLRKKVGMPPLIETVIGAGYRIK
jgi:DNA-binding response OmpR family regulator